MSSFSLLEAGRGKARYVSARGRLGMGVLTSDWRFRRSHSVQSMMSEIECGNLSTLRQTQESSRPMGPKVPGQKNL